jgi:hypothetical protein
VEENKLTKKQKAEKEFMDSIRIQAQEENLDEEELITSVYFLQKHKKIILRSAKKLSEYEGVNYAPTLLGNIILILLQLSEYEDPEYMHSAINSLIEVYKQATRDNAEPSELFEIMAATSLLENKDISPSE